jgi:hypothetical protein
MRDRFVIYCTCGFAALATASLQARAQGQRFTFEPAPYSASAGGTLLTGQNGWYLPPIAGSVDFNAFTYAGNAYGFPANPEGGSQFISGRWIGNTSFARGQHPLDFSAGGQWIATWDVAAKFDGTLPAVENLGSFSLQVSTTARYWQQLMNWGTHAATADLYDINYGVFDAVGVTITFLSPGPAWQGLAVNHWYRQTTKWNFATNLITEVSITDLATGTTTTANPVGWYLAGGAAPALPMPTDIRVFAGGSGTTTVGNITAWDNITVAPVCGSADFNCDGDVGTDADIEAFFACLGGNCPDVPCPSNADFNGDGDVGTDSDIEAFFRVLGGGAC